MDDREFQTRLRKAIVFHVANAKAFTWVMDDLTVDCSDEQWAEVEAALEQVDEWLGDTEKGTAYQKEKNAAKREGRKSHYPNVFNQGTPEADAMIEQLKKEFGTIE